MKFSLGRLARWVIAGIAAFSLAAYVTTTSSSAVQVPLSQTLASASVPGQGASLQEQLKVVNDKHTADALDAYLASWVGRCNSSLYSPGSPGQQSRVTCYDNLLGYLGFADGGRKLPPQSLSGPETQKVTDRYIVLAWENELTGRQVLCDQTSHENGDTAKNNCLAGMLGLLGYVPPGQS